MSFDTEPVIVEALRTPFGRRRGALAGVRPDDLAAWLVRQVLDRTGTPGEALGDVLVGCATPSGEQGWNIGRQVVLLAGLPPEVPGLTINRMCASSDQAVRFAAHVQSLAGLECDAMVEIGASPVLVSLAQRCWPTGSAVSATLASLRPGRADDDVLAEALAALYVRGATPDWAAWDRPWSRARVPLPTYPFQRVPYVVGASPRPQPKQALDGLLYEVVWQEAPPLGDAPVPAGPLADCGNRAGAGRGARGTASGQPHRVSSGRRHTFRLARVAAPAFTGS